MGQNYIKNLTIYFYIAFITFVNKIKIMQSEQRKILYSFSYPILFIVFLWIIKLIEIKSGTSFAIYGIYPLQAKGLIGIIAMPLIHADINHLFANSVPLIVLGAGLFYFYREIAFPSFFLIYILSGLWVWLFSRGIYPHIGASGLVYGLAAFHFVSGIIRRDNKLMAFSLLIVFLYGSLIWGFFPEFFPEKNISWEGHLMGAIAGFVIAIYYRKKGPQKEEYVWDDDDDENNTTIIYHLKDKE